ncbi:MAG TPA: hypothetical protein VFV02_10680, partial [Acidimicrobiales bacterium]|nr:hypothetical protein [Acidimicrobiales bacterium]
MSRVRENRMHGSMGGGRKPEPVGKSARSQAPLAYPTNLLLLLQCLLVLRIVANDRSARAADEDRRHPQRKPQRLAGAHDLARSGGRSPPGSRPEVPDPPT